MFFTPVPDDFVGNCIKTDLGLSGSGVRAVGRGLA